MYIFILETGKNRNLLLFDACSTIIHALIRCRLDYCNSILYNVPMRKRIFTTTSESMRAPVEKISAMATYYPSFENIILTQNSIY